MLKNIILSAEEDLIRSARKTADLRQETLDTAFRHWLEEYVENNVATLNYRSLMNELSYVKVGKHFTRDGFNEN